MNIEAFPHRSTKEIIAARIAKSGASLRVMLWNDRTTTPWLLDLTDLVPVIECAYPDGIAVSDVAAYRKKKGRLPKMIFDVGLVHQPTGIVVGAFEIVRSNPLSVEKMRKIIAGDLFAVVIDAFEVDRGELLDSGRFDATKLVFGP